MGKVAVLLTVLFAVFCMGMTRGCDTQQESDAIQKEQQETLLQEATAQTGMPAVKNFRERKLLKDIIEMRDQDGLVTYTYTFSEMTGEYKFFCDSIGYGLPYATQYTNPQKQISDMLYESPVIAQADPNGLFSPDSAEGTWVLCKDPAGDSVKPIYMEPRVIVSPFKLPEKKTAGTVAPVEEVPK